VRIVTAGTVWTDPDEESAVRDSVRGLDTFALRRPISWRAGRIRSRPSRNPTREGRTASLRWMPAALSRPTVPIDFEYKRRPRSGGDALQSALPAFFSWLGTTYY